MDCCICGPMAAIYRIPIRNTICQSCYEGAKSMTSLIKNIIDQDGDDTIPNQSSDGSHPNPPKSLSDVVKWMEERKNMEEGQRKKIRFLGAFKFAFREGIHTDIFVKPSSGSPIPAHKALLATRSVIFKTMLGSDECKAPAEDIISLPDLNHEELECLLDFLYSGTLPDTMAEKHAYVLLQAADKYQIPYLKKACEDHLLLSLGPGTVLDVLEVSEVSSSDVLKESAMELIGKCVDDVVFSGRFDVFALNNPHLCVELMRMMVKDLKLKTGQNNCGEDG